MILLKLPALVVAGPKGEAGFGEGFVRDDERGEGNVGAAQTSLAGFDLSGKSDFRMGEVIGF